MDADLGRGGAGPRRAPILPGSLLIQLHGWQTAPPRGMRCFVSSGSFGVSPLP